ncbi:protein DETOXIFICATION 13-like [Zingiber officinale]|uniref:protein DETOXIFICATION 13-like n=1 Tax=Zingiber officinale TaxID=94328 RepID=UPI001C4CE86E|nr:protein DETOXIFICATION 13-like [Zingiber officinale]
MEESGRINVTMTAREYELFKEAKRRVASEKQATVSRPRQAPIEASKEPVPVSDRGYKRKQPEGFPQGGQPRPDLAGPSTHQLGREKEPEGEPILLTPLLSISIFLNGVQPILSGVAIGSGWQAIVAYVNVGAYHLIGLPIAIVLGFKTGLAAAGIWWGLIIGVFVQTVSLIVLTARTNWNREVHKLMLIHETLFLQKKKNKIKILIV